MSSSSPSPSSVVVDAAAVAKKLEELCEGLSAGQVRVMTLASEGKNVFCTGCGGTGKSFLLGKRLRELLGFLHKRYSVTATTGIASLNVGGCTIHRYSGMGIRKYLRVQDEMSKIRRNKQKEWQQLHVLIIDEVSMLSRDAFDDLCLIAQELRGNRRDPMGGLQVIYFGDFFQLGPIYKKGTTDTHCFKSKMWARVFPPAQCVELTHIFRQDDPEFKEHLNNLRVGNVTDETDAFFRSLDRPFETPAGIRPTRLYCYNNDVDKENRRELDKIEGEEHAFDSQDTQGGALPAQPGQKREVRSPYFPSQNKLSTDEIDKRVLAKNRLVLKKGAQVMMLKNTFADMGIVNGSVGVVTGFMDDPDLSPELKQMASIAALTDDKARLLACCPIVSFVNKRGEVSPQVVYGMDFEMHEGTELVAVRNQIPLVVCYATTIHKSQGMSIKYLEVVFGGGQGTFECGQAYVALSRAISKDTMRVHNFRKSLVMIDLEVVNFYKQFSGGAFDPADEKNNLKRKLQDDEDSSAAKKPNTNIS